MAARQRVYFGHRSVGGSIIRAIPRVYEDHRQAPPPIASYPSADGSEGVLWHGYIGANGNPSFKIADFAAQLRGGIAQEVDVVLMKFCYVDITANTNVQGLFAEYVRTFGRLERSFPRVAFVHITAPLTTGHPRDNLARQRFNQRMRDRYGGTGRLFDLAAIEATRPDGTLVTGTFSGQRYTSLYRGYSSDGGHLNTAGSERAAAGFLKSIVRATRD